MRVFSLFLVCHVIPVSVLWLQALLGVPASVRIVLIIIILVLKLFVCMPRKVTEAFYFFKGNMYLTIEDRYFHPRPIAHYVHMYAFVHWLVTFPAPDALMMCLHISAPIVSNDLVTARQPCNLLSQLSTCMDVEHSLCVQCVQTCTHTHCMFRRLWPCMGCHIDLTQTAVLCRCTYGVHLAGYMSKLCLPNCTVIHNHHNSDISQIGILNSTVCTHFIANNYIHYWRTWTDLLLYLCLSLLCVTACDVQVWYTH